VDNFYRVNQTTNKTLVIKISWGMFISPYQN
jgi:hypothetical protein